MTIDPPTIAVRMRIARVTIGFGSFIIFDQFEAVFFSAD
jgi:hypothetical protein